MSKLTELPDDKKNYIKVAVIAKELGCDIRHIYYAIRKNYVDAVDLEDSKYVNPEQTRSWYNNRDGKRGRKPTRTSEGFESVARTSPGTIFSTIVQVQRSFKVVEGVEQVENNAMMITTSNHERFTNPFKGLNYVMGHKLIDDLKSGRVEAINDNMQLLEALARSFQVMGYNDIANKLYDLHIENKELALSNIVVVLPKK